jgi:hypothetical protein
LGLAKNDRTIAFADVQPNKMGGVLRRVIGGDSVTALQDSCL